MDELVHLAAWHRRQADAIGTATGRTLHLWAAQQVELYLATTVAATTTWVTDRSTVTACCGWWS